ncbi:MAG: sulfatase-like hydrolase/transferase [Clostridia bacterium]|nr:sulfatase-like hydrolase/transferase [Clostridia bacterium]
MSKKDKTEKPRKEKVKKPSKIRDGIKKCFSYLNAHPVLLIVVLSYCLTFLTEILGRHSCWGALVFEFTKPIMFLTNMSIIALTLSIALLSKKRTYWLCVISLIWFGLGITNFVMLFNRITPFNAMDFLLMTSVLPILPVYIGWVGLILAGIVLFAVIVAVIVAWFKVKKSKVNYTQAAAAILSCIILTTAFVGGGALSGSIPAHFSSLPRAYDAHGFALCFSISIFDRGVSKPRNYDKNIDDIVDFVKGDDTDGFTQPEKTPNIIFVQLESFYDLKLLKEFEFSEDPTPIFTELKKNWTTGVLTVPSIGAGTANTEFEVLTGLTMQHLGSAEYPYRTFLQNQTCESVPFILKNYGYSSHAIHNYKGNFYDRHKAFSTLGFDTFTSREYMELLGKNFAGWEQDAVLLKSITDVLSSTEGPDFIQCITVQGHGKYPVVSYDGESEEVIKPTKLPEGANKHAYTYFANQLYATDLFIGDLIAAVENIDEETVIVFYGDHIPNIGFEEEWIPDGTTLYDTEYIIWRSDGVRGENKNITSYQLYSEVFASLNIEGGIISKLHDKRAELSADDYDYYLHALQYDIIENEGEKSYDGKLPFKATDLKMGIIDVTITDIYVGDEYVYVNGTGFTEASQIFVNGSHEETEYLDDNTLILKGVTLKDGDKIKVSQIADFFSPPLSSTESFVYQEVTNEE